MTLRGIDFGPIFCASGAQGFFGEGYLHHRLFRPFGCDFTGCTFVAKTTTLPPNEGNMPMGYDGITPRDVFPRCIRVNFRKGVILNAVGLSGPGAEPLFETGWWQARTKPFFISFMSVKKSAEERTGELERFVKLFARYLPRFRAPVGLQINYSCPNVGLDPYLLVDEAKSGLQIASALRIPLMPKFSILARTAAVIEISQSPHCDAICVSNTIPYGKLPERIDWKGLFGSDVSPFADLGFGWGGLSGKPLLDLVAEWVLKASSVGLNKPINAGGGILSRKDVSYMRYGARVSSVFIGSVATLRPWRVKGIIKRAHELF
ncbi:MAG: hypothetical protein NT155_00480 [Candidatus Staskawiczbacteria bacterium]|nr:hypothetical protein [Candidatus Staskawiczbacteria bacterium]